MKFTKFVSQLALMDLFNKASLLLSQNNLPEALIALNQSVQQMPSLAVSHMQIGYIHIAQKNHQLAIASYDTILNLLAENDFIDYSDQGLKYRLYKCEVFLNRAVCHKLSNNTQAALADLSQATDLARTPDHNAVINAASSSKLSDLSLFTVPSNAQFEAIQEDAPQNTLPEPARDNPQESQTDFSFDDSSKLKKSLFEKKSLYRFSKTKSPTRMSPSTPSGIRLPSRSASLSRKHSKQSDATPPLPPIPKTPTGSSSSRPAMQRSNTTVKPRQPNPPRLDRSNTIGGLVTSKPNLSRSKSLHRTATTTTSSSPSPFTKLRVHSNTRTITIHVPNPVTYQTLVSMICKRFGIDTVPGGLMYPDHDDGDDGSCVWIPGCMISVRDNDDVVEMVKSEYGHLYFGEVFSNNVA